MLSRSKHTRERAAGAHIYGPHACMRERTISLATYRSIVYLRGLNDCLEWQGPLYHYILLDAFVLQVKTKRKSGLQGSLSGRRRHEDNSSHSSVITQRREWIAVFCDQDRMCVARSHVCRLRRITCVSIQCEFEPVRIRALVGNHHHRIASRPRSVLGDKQCLCLCQQLRSWYQQFKSSCQQLMSLCKQMKRIPCKQLKSSCSLTSSCGSV